MDISAGLIAKTLGALAAATAVSGGTWLMFGGEDEVKSNKITKYDQALIDYLHDGGKVQFAVTSGGATITEFPKNFSGSDPQKVTVTVKIKVSENDANTEGKLVDNPNATEGSKSKKSYLLGINKDNDDWTWICEMNFTREKKSNTIDTINDAQKDKVFKADNEGLFGKLKKDITTTGYQEEKRLKKEFIKKCGHDRGVEENKKINESENKNEEIKTPGEKISFELIKGEANKPWGADDKKLFFKEKNKFNRWFSESQKSSRTAAA